MSVIIEKEYTEFEIADCYSLYSQIVSTHKECQGQGFILQRTGIGVEDCDCESVFRYVKALLYARIPKRYWTVTYDSRKQIFEVPSDLKLFEKSVDNYLSDCTTIVLGGPGCGKTALLSLFGKIAIWSNKNVFYLTVEDLLDFVRKESEYRIYIDRMLGSEIVLIDDITKFHRNEWASSQIEYNLRKLYDNGANIIISSSLALPDIKDKLSIGVYSILKRFPNALITNWSGKPLNTHNDYLFSPILDEARKYFKSVLTL